ncbi:MAG: YceI family protein [Tepidisphaeraceae bacterium]
MKTRLTLTALVAVFALAMQAGSVRAADNYKVDSAHSSVLFKVDHFGVAPFYGRFNAPTGTVTLDKEDPTKSSFTFELKTENVDTGNEKRDAHLKTPDFFDAKQFPTITFKSKSVKGLADDKFEVTGDLTLHGVTKEIKLILNKTAEKDTGKMGFRTGWTTDVNLKRSDYGMTQMIGPVGDDVQIIIAYEAVKS